MEVCGNKIRLWEDSHKTMVNVSQPTLLYK